MRTVGCFAILAILGLSLLVDAAVPRPYRRNMIRGRPRGGFKPKPTRDAESITRASTHGWFTQQLDHIGNATGTFQQQYWYNNQWYQPGGPVFLMLGGEGPEDSYWVESATLEWTSIAKQVGAWVFLVEHRYYGATQPTPDMSTSNLLWLSSVQAIEDFATFIRAMKTQFNQLSTAKWVTFGGSYSGNLAAWMRVKHPELVSYAVGSSGPVFAEVDFNQYLEVVQASITTTSASCAASVANSMATVANLLTTSAGRASLKSTFNLCESIDPNNALMIQTFWETVYSPYMEIVQYSGDNAGFFANQLTIPNAICRFHNNNASSPLDKLKNVNDYFDTTYGFFGCNDIDYTAYIQFMQDVSWGEAADDRAWVWQTCTEFGYYQSTSSSTAGPFWGGVGSLPAAYYVNQCAQIYGSAYNSDEVNAAVAATNAYYGGRDNMQSSYIILPNGSFDPWHALGKLTAMNGTNIIPVVINTTSHCADMYATGTRDPVSLTNARQTIKNTLIGWLNS